MSKYFKFDEKFELRIDKDGRWFHNDEEITHPGVYKYLNSLLDVDDKGYFISDGKVKFYVQVEDTPFIVKSLINKDNKVFLVLNDDYEELLDPETLEIKDEVFYVKVKNKKFPARFSRKAQNQLYGFVSETEDGFVIKVNNKEKKFSFT